ncbi:MAG TPA: hypothetical protein VFF78_08775 [Anaerolineaceae bacterium]|nr:hypothetical protein [Anaerolineaceae bacterium]
MNTNFYAIEIASATHDAEQLKALRQAQMPRAMRATYANLFDTLSRFFSHPTSGITQQTAAHAY